MIATVMRERARFCNPHCRDAFRCDRQCGLIYGPYARVDDQGRVIGWFDGPGEFSLETGTCAYCSSYVQEPTPA